MHLRIQKSGYEQKPWHARIEAYKKRRKLHVVRSVGVVTANVTRKTAERGRPGMTEVLQRMLSLLQTGYQEYAAGLVNSATVRKLNVVEFVCFHVLDALPESDDDCRVLARVLLRQHANELSAFEKRTGYPIRGAFLAMRKDPEHVPWHSTKRLRKAQEKAS